MPIEVTKLRFKHLPPSVCPSDPYGVKGAYFIKAYFDGVKYGEWGNWALKEVSDEAYEEIKAAFIAKGITKHKES